MRRLDLAYMLLSVSTGVGGGLRRIYVSGERLVQSLGAHMGYTTLGAF